MKMIVAIVALAWMSAVSSADAQIFRCAEGGRTVYSDKPCGDASATTSVPVVPRAAEPTPSAQLQLEALRGRLAVGMTAAQVELAWGKPVTVNARTGSRGRSDQWVYRRVGGDSYVYIENGVVTSFTTSTTTATPTPEPPPKVISSTEREAAVRADRANERRFVREGEARATIETKLGTPDGSGFTTGMLWWTYAPTPKDYQTRTTIWFDGDRVFKIERKVER